MQTGCKRIFNKTRPGKYQLQRFINVQKDWGNLDLNQGPTGYESAALTAELLPRDRRNEAYHRQLSLTREKAFKGIIIYTFFRFSHCAFF